MLTGDNENVLIVVTNHELRLSLGKLLVLNSKNIIDHTNGMLYKIRNPNSIELLRRLYENRYKQ